MYNYTELESCLFYKTLNISKLTINDLDHFHNYGHNLQLNKFFFINCQEILKEIKT